MPLDSYIDTLVNRLRRRQKIRPDKQNQQSDINGDKQPTEHNPQQPFGPFNNAHNFVLNNVKFIENTSGKTVLELLESYATLDATMDSSARHPPPKCHPGTRAHICQKLERWLVNHERLWKMIWLHGPAGTGKSAVAQTFAEHCAGQGLLGASYFFSRLNNRNKPETVIPTLAYQLAACWPDYRSLLATELVSDPRLLKKALPVQFRKLIVEPLFLLQRQHAREPFVIILDGFDECDGEDAQCEIIELIAEVLRLKTDFPLLWLICSRPEAHLEYAFSRITDCGREELPIDAECRDDVERYLRDGFAVVKDKYWTTMPASWPPEDEFLELLHIVSGLFVLASTALKYVGDSTYANPVDRFNTLMGFFRRTQGIGTINPLATLDLLYMQILTDVPSTVFPTTQRILSYLIFLPNTSATPSPKSAQALCNFLCLDQHTFYTALRKVYSVIEVPIPRDAVNFPVRFYHASFGDFLLDSARSGRFFIDRQSVLIDIAKSYLSWHQTDCTLFHTHEALHRSGDQVPHQDHGHGCLPGLKWTSPDNEQDLSTEIAKTSATNCWDAFTSLSPSSHSQELLSQIYDFDFRYVRPSTWDFFNFVNWVYEQNPSDHFLRTEPLEKHDYQLLKYLGVVIGSSLPKQTTFPLHRYRHVPAFGTSEYFFIGRGAKTAVVWDIGYRYGVVVWLLNGDKEPSEEVVSRYWNVLEGYGLTRHDGCLKNVYEEGSDGESVTSSAAECDVEDDSSVSGAEGGLGARSAKHE